MANDLPTIDTQQGILVEVCRLILEGKWDEARINLDAIDPAKAGSWTNVPFDAGQS